jgi:hypothetical protein
MHFVSMSLLSGPEDFTLNVITSNDFQSILQNTEPSLIQVQSLAIICSDVTSIGDVCIYLLININL